jgi:hypothetical protein
MRYSDVMIALGFTQLMFEAKTSKDIAAAASRSLKRKLLPEVIEFRGWSDPDERRHRCNDMLRVMKDAL